MNHLRAALPIVFTLLLVACAPAVQKPALIYEASVQDVLSAAAEYGPQIQPADAYEYLAVESTTPTSISFRAGLNSGLGAFVKASGSDAVVTLTVTASKVNQGTLVGLSSTAPGDRLAPHTIDIMTNVLNQLFERVTPTN